MYRHDHWVDDGADETVADRQTAGLAGIVIILLLLIGGLFLIQQLRTASAYQDCVMSGRSNCDVIVAGHHTGGAP